MAAIAAADASNRKTLIKQSAVQRGQQGGGARSPDIKTPTNWWLELANLQEGTGRADGSDKLEQAERDIAFMGDGYRAAVIWSRKGSRLINVTMRISTLIETLSSGGGSWSCAFKAASSSTAVIPFETFCKILEAQYVASR